jgi:putative spermidine/putrescine transport system substrate-binding protein
MRDPRLEQLMPERWNDQLTRRQLARRLSILGVSASAFSAAMASGGVSAFAAQDASPEAATPDDAPSDEIITSPSFEGQTLVVTSYGGTWEEFMRAEILPAFEEATGAEIELAVGLSTDWMTKLRAAGADDPPYDVVIANETYISTGRIGGFFESLPIDKVPNLDNVHESLRLSDDVGVFALVAPIGLGYMTDEVTIDTAPSWLELNTFLPGLGIYNIKNSAAAQHIMMTAEAITGDYQDWEPGFDWIRDNLRDAKQSDFSGDMETLLTAGEIQAGLLDAPAVARLKSQGIAIEWTGPEEGLLMFEQNTNVTTGSEVKDLAYSFVNYWLGVDVQTKFSESYFWTPSNVHVEIGAELAESIPVTRENLDRMKQWDYEWLNSGPREEMIQRWNREMTF